ncbi:HAD family hydrolase [Paenibacillus tarimensis]|uniref:HAD family hydrolase n=1 Tax=Paenibacillus tarimensis TaxID=416012 RepID=UPI001F25A1D2|nr:HAD family hydrolase [Paenibacillus tarimensis]MCF2945771.1 HAD family hydrolase [Paenibacillus tarimensis]
MSAIRLIVSDLDGTLLSPDHSLSKSVIDAVKEFTSRGGLFTFATGRPFLTAAAFETQLQLQLPYILCNGSVLACTGQIVESQDFMLDDLAGLLEEADEQLVDVLMFGEGGVSVFRASEPVAAYEAKEKVACSLVDRTADSSWRMGRVQKVILMGDMNVIRPLWERHQPGLKLQYSTFQSEINYWEIIPPGQSKGAALRRLAERLDIRPDEIMAIGNQMNDLDMLLAAEIGVAVANSPDELKAQADYVCEAGYGDGVVEALRRFCLNSGPVTPVVEI